jgi:hypothetical protein
MPDDEPTEIELSVCHYPRAVSALVAPKLRWSHALSTLPVGQHASMNCALRLRTRSSRASAQRDGAS